MKLEALKVLRPFYLDGKPTKVGEIVEVPSSLSAELRAAKKAEKTEKVEKVEAPKPQVLSAAKPPKGEK